MSGDIDPLVDVDLAAAQLTECRRDVVECLEEVAEELDEQKRNVHISNTSFASAGVLGGAASLAGVVFAPFTAGLSLVLTAGGMGLAATSVAGSVGTKITDSVLKNKKIKRAKEAIARYNTAVEDLGRKVDVLDDETKHDLTTVLDAVKSDQSNLLKLTNMSVRVLTTGRELAKVLKSMKGVGIANTLAKEFMEGSKMIAGTVTPGVVNTVASGGVKGLANAGKILGSAFSVFNIGFDVATIVNNAVAIHKKAPHEIAEKLREIIKDIDSQEEK